MYVDSAHLAAAPLCLYSQGLNSNSQHPDDVCCIQVMNYRMQKEVSKMQQAEIQNLIWKKEAAEKQGLYDRIASSVVNHEAKRAISNTGDWHSVLIKFLTLLILYYC